MKDFTCSEVELLRLNPSKKVFLRFFTHFKSNAVLTEFSEHSVSRIIPDGYFLHKIISSGVQA